jgi:hypothetical protein
MTGSIVQGPIYSKHGKRERREERGERKLTWVGVNGSLGFCPFWRERGERREEREMKRERERKKEKEMGREERESPGNMRERERERELKMCIYQHIWVVTIKYKGKSI